MLSLPPVVATSKEMEIETAFELCTQSGTKRSTQFAKILAAMGIRSIVHFLNLAEAHEFVLEDAAARTALEEQVVHEFRGYAIGYGVDAEEIAACFDSAHAKQTILKVIGLIRAHAPIEAAIIASHAQATVHAMQARRTEPPPSAVGLPPGINTFARKSTEAGAEGHSTSTAKAQIVNEYIERIAASLGIANAGQPMLKSQLPKSAIMAALLSDILDQGCLSPLQVYAPIEFADTRSDKVTVAQMKGVLNDLMYALFGIYCGPTDQEPCKLFVMSKYVTSQNLSKIVAPALEDGTVRSEMCFHFGQSFMSHLALLKFLDCRFTGATKEQAWAFGRLFFNRHLLREVKRGDPMTQIVESLTSDDALVLPEKVSKKEPEVEEEDYSGDDAPRGGKGKVVRSTSAPSRRSERTTPPPPEVAKSVRGQRKRDPDSSEDEAPPARRSPRLDRSLTLAAGGSATYKSKAWGGSSISKMVCYNYSQGKPCVSDPCKYSHDPVYVEENRRQRVVSNVAFAAEKRAQAIAAREVLPKVKGGRKSKAAVAPPGSSEEISVSEGSASDEEVPVVRRKGGKSRK